MFAVEFEPSLLFGRRWFAIKVPHAIARMLAEKKVIEPLELQRLLHRQSDEGVWLLGIRLISPWKDSSFGHAHDSTKQPRAMLTLSCVAFVVKELSVVGRFGQITAHCLRKHTQAA